MNVYTLLQPPEIIGQSLLPNRCIGSLYDMPILKEVAGDILQDGDDAFGWKWIGCIKNTVCLRAKILAAVHRVVDVGFDYVLCVRKR